MCTLYFVLSFVFLVKGPIQIFLVHRIEDLLKQLCKHFYALHDFGGAGESRWSVRYDTSRLIVEEVFEFCSSVCADWYFVIQKNVLLHFNT